MAAQRGRSIARLLLPWASVTLIAGSTAMLAWGYWPSARRIDRLELDRGASIGAAAAYIDFIELDSPHRIRLQDRAVVHLRVGLLDATAPGSGPDQPASPSTGPPEIVPIGEARLELLDAEIRPPEAISEAFPALYSQSFVWSVMPSRPGELRGIAWYFLRLPDTESAAAHQRIAVSAQPVIIRADTFLGLGGATARLGGALGFLTGVIVGLARPRIHHVSQSAQRGL